MLALFSASGLQRIEAQTSGALYYPQVAIGGGYTTVFTLTNTGESTAAAILALTDRNGADLTVALNDSGRLTTGSSFALSIPPGASRVLVASAPGPSDPVRSGWGQLVLTAGSLWGVATFQFVEAGAMKTIAGILASQSVEAAVAPVDNDGGTRRFTGYAIANPNSFPINIQVTLKDESGSVVETSSPARLNPLQAGSQAAVFVHEDFPARLVFRGSMTISSTGGAGFGAVALVQDRGLLTAIPVTRPPADTVLLSNGGSGENGVLVDGFKSGIFQNDRGYNARAGAAVDIGSFEAPAGEIVAFTNDRPPRVQANVAWTNNPDSISLRFENTYRVPFYIWVVQGPFENQRTVALNATLRTAQIWSEERQGIAFSSVEVTDATTNPEAPNFHAFTCGKAADMRSRIGFNTGGVNVYYVDTVDFGSSPATTNGVWCGSDTVAMGRNASDNLFAHEIGHAFALGHTNTIPEYFDTTNVMHNASNNRRYLTEGQTFRAVFESGSVLNNVYNIRPGQVTRGCGNSTSTNNSICPAVQKRIWADGIAWPPNEPSRMPAPALESEEVLRHYLAVDCEVGEPGEALGRLLRSSPAVEALGAILRNGPSAEERAVFRGILNEDWSMRGQFVRSGELAAWDAAYLNSIRALSRDQFVAEGEALLERKHREKAAGALAALGSGGALRELERARQDADPDTQRIIDAALSRFQRR